MRRVLITSSRSPGLIIPLLQIAAALVERGDKVFVLTGADYERQVTNAGATFLRLSFDDSAPVRYSAERGGIRGLGATLERLFLSTIEVEYRDVVALCAEHRIDIVLTEPFFGGSMLLGLRPRTKRPAVVTLGLFPLVMPSPDTAPFGLGMTPKYGPLNRLRNTLLNFVADRILLAGTARAFHRATERLTGVRPSGPLFNLALSTDVYAQMTVPQFEYPRRSMPDKVRFIGPLPPAALGTLPEWWNYSDRRPIVYVTQGTYANEDFSELIVPTIRALANEPVLVIATTGGPDPSSVEDAYGGPLPDNARVATFLPYTHLLAAATVIVTNGGYGSVQHALRWGRPLVVAGVSEDRREVNARVAWTGVGINLRTQRPTEEQLRTAVRTVMQNPGYRHSAVRMGSAIAGANPIASLLAIVDELSDQSTDLRTAP